MTILDSNKRVLSRYPAPANLKGNGSSLIFDFGKEFGGIITVNYSAPGSGSLGLAFTEAKNWTGTWSDSSNGGRGPDGALYANITTTSKGSYTMPDAKLRGGSRYLTLFTAIDASTSVSITAITLEISAFKNSDVDGSIHPEDGNSMALLFDGADAAYTARISHQLTTNWCPIGAVTPEQPYNIVPLVESFEIKGHLAIRQTQRALDLVRLSWGWYLNNPYGTGSTTIEGYLDDGTFRYANDGYNADGSYPSHAHGWSTDPTDALTSYVLGLRLTAPGGSAWTLAPQFGDLKAVEGGFTTPLGKFSASWKLTSGGYTLEYDVPENSTGTLVLPSKSKAACVELDGRKEDGRWDTSSGLTMLNASGGKHKFTVKY
ncbi:hypothetical protein B0A49_01458 [Cryomyces minteri]|uniref:Alpha-L-rhamnosidase C-terminal domain-containing protein n=1 Tax=Cryomyces minteri TaxID=331657 RepID=A0A4U0XQ93_9PEZI|nr:hypothetical protein B0A49_01458 [Cryomyces minteri]